MSDIPNPVSSPCRLPLDTLVPRSGAGVAKLDRRSEDDLGAREHNLLRRHSYFDGHDTLLCTAYP